MSVVAKYNHKHRGTHTFSEFIDWLADQKWINATMDEVLRDMTEGELQWEVVEYDTFVRGPDRYGAATARRYGLSATDLAAQGWQRMKLYDVGEIQLALRGRFGVICHWCRNVSKGNGVYEATSRGTRFRCEVCESISTEILLGNASPDEMLRSDRIASGLRYVHRRIKRDARKDTTGPAARYSMMLEALVPALHQIKRPKRQRRGIPA